MSYMYGSVALATTYHAAVGNAAWATYLEPAQTSALIRASRAFDGRYGRMFSGYKYDPAQRAAWPRREAYDQCAGELVTDGETPPGILEAVYELALVEAARPGSLSPSVTLGRLTQSESVDVISRSFFKPADLTVLAMGDNPLNAYRPTFAVVEDLVGCFLKKAEMWTARVV